MDTITNESISTNRPEQIITRAVLDYLDLALLIFTIMDANPYFYKAIFLSDKSLLLKAQPYFKQIIDKIESFSQETINTLQLEKETLFADDKHNIKRIYIKNAIEGLFVFIRYGMNEHKSNLRTYKQLQSLILHENKRYSSLIEFKTDLINEMMKARIEYQNDRGLALFTLQIALLFQNAVEHISAPTSEYAIFFYHTYYNEINPILQSKSHYESSKIFLNFMMDILNPNYLGYREYNKFLNKEITLLCFPDESRVMTQTVDHLFHVYRKNTDYRSNHKFFKIHEMGIQLFLYELPPRSFKVSEPYPNYLWEISKLKHHMIIIGMCSKRYIKTIEKRYQRVLNIYYSRSLASHIFENKQLYSLDYQKLATKNYPSFMRKFNFKYSKNTLKKKYKGKQISFADIQDIYNYSSDPSYFDKVYMKSSKEQIDFIRENLVLNQLPTRELITNIPLGLGVLKHDRILVLYIKFIFNTKTYSKLNKTDLINKNTSKVNYQIIEQSLKDEISKYLQFWSHRAEIMELKHGMYAIIILSGLEEYFLIQLRTLFHNFQRLHSGLQIILDSEIYSKGKSKDNNTRHRTMYPLIGPEIKKFNKNTGEFDLILPKKSQIIKEFNINIEKHSNNNSPHTKTFQLKGFLHRPKYIFLKHGKPIIDIQKDNIDESLQKINDINALKIYNYLNVYGYNEGFTIEELANKVNIKKTTVHDTLKRLISYNLIEKKQSSNTTGIGRPKMYYYVQKSKIQDDKIIKL